MSYSFRNRPKLSDRYRGKSGDEILNELKSQIDEDRKMFFESSPDWNSVQSPRSFSRAGHPLDEMMSRGRQDIRSHLDDLAQRHPEFADHLRCPPWGGEIGATSRSSWGRKRRGSGSSGDDVAGQEPLSQGVHSAEEASPSRGRSRQNNLPQYGLRNTVDLGQQHQKQQDQQTEDQERGRGQRSWSAPPDNRTQNPPDPPRFVSRLDIPVNPMPAASGVDQGKPPVAPKLQQQPSPQQSANSKQPPGSNVRHIPIFVEGRDEPLLPKDDAPTEKIFTERVPPHPTTFNYSRPSQFTSRQSQEQTTPQMPQQPSHHQNTAPPKAKTFMQQQQVPPQQQCPPTHERPENSWQREEQNQPKGAPQPPKQPNANDPIFHVQAVQKDVDELKLKVDTYGGNSRKDKDYIYLDEMLTRNLLKLDNIETEGKEDVRQARKAVIRNIQQCIGILESKVPSSEEVCESSVEEIEKLSNEPCEKQISENSDRLAVILPETGSNIADASTEKNVSQIVLSQDSSDLKMDAETLQQMQINKTEQQAPVINSQSELAMETESIGNVNKESSEQIKSDINNLEVIDDQILKSDDLPQTSTEQLHLVSEKSKNTVQSAMQVDENDSKIQPLLERMEFDISTRKETIPLTVKNSESGEKSTNLSLKGDGDIGSNKPIKNKSPKGSPKKGKRAS